MKEEAMANKEQKRKTREAKKPKQKKKESPKRGGQQGATSYQDLKTQPSIGGP
jgi:hypothetical protein